MNEVDSGTELDSQGEEDTEEKEEAEETTKDEAEKKEDWFNKEWYLILNFVSFYNHLDVLSQSKPIFFTLDIIVCKLD